MLVLIAGLAIFVVVQRVQYDELLAAAEARMYNAQSQAEIQAKGHTACIGSLESHVASLKREVEMNAREAQALRDRFGAELIARTPPGDPEKEAEPMPPPVGPSRLGL